MLFPSCLHALVDSSLASCLRRLEGQKLSSFTGVSSFVSDAFEESLEGILNKRQVDVLLDIQRSQVSRISGMDWE